MRFAKFATPLEQGQDKVVIAGAGCHCGRRLSLRAPAVIADSIRNPVVGWHWIPDQVGDDKLGAGTTNWAAGTTIWTSGPTNPGPV